MNLFENKELWNSVNLNESKPNWKWEDSFLTQKKLTEDRKFPTGFMQVSQPSESFNKLSCSFTPGSIYITGVVFNYKDAENFMIAVINKLSASYEGYRIEIGELIENNYRSVCKERYRKRLDEPSIFTLFNTQSGLSISLNNEEVFLWNGIEVESHLKAGIYTQQNDDAVFRSFEVQQTDENTNEPVEEDFGDIIFPPSEDSYPNGQNELNDYLSIKSPKSHSQVEFNEAFAVPLDSFYNHLNEVVHSEKSNSYFAVEKTEQLDLRPRRWYRQLREIVEKAEFLNTDLTRYKALAAKAKGILDEELNSDGLDMDKLAELENKYYAIVARQRESQKQLDAINEEKSALLREIRTNGFLVEKLDSKSDIYKMGYPLSISNPIPKGRGFKPLTVDAGFDYKSDAEWKKLETKLYKSLFDTGAITEEGKSIYLNEQGQLLDLASNDQIDQELKSLNKTIKGLESDIISKNKLITHHTTELDAWEKDRDLLKVQKGKYQTFSASNYPAGGQPTTSRTMSNEFASLNNWIADQKKLEISRDEFLVKLSEYNQTRPSCGNRNPPPLVNNFGEYKMERLKLNTSRYTNYSGQNKMEMTRIGLFYPEINIVSGLHINCFYNTLPLTTVIVYKVQETFCYPHMLNIRDYFDKCIAVCDHHIHKHQKALYELHNNNSKLKIELKLVEDLRKDIEENKLAALRKEFITFWNDAENSMLQDLQFELINPDSDPLSDFLVKLEAGADKKEFLKTYFYTATEDGYYNQFGQSLRDFMKNTVLKSQLNISLFPILDNNGENSNEVIKVVKNPKLSGLKPSLPIIKFIETYQVDISWQGYGLGDLSHSINLFPGESKELVIDKKTKISSKTERNKSQSTETKQHITSSFEDNLQNTLSEQDKSSLKSEQSQKTDSSRTGEDNSASSSEQSSTISAEVKASAKWGWGDASASLKSDRNSKNTNTASTKRAFALAQTNEGLKASNQSKDVLKKNVSNTIKKVANDTSQNNKVEFSAVSTEEFQEDISNKEVIKLENPNIGRTVNYNFFQVQNHYGTQLKLTDVKIVISLGKEIIEGTGIQDTRVYELEEFGKIFADSEGSAHDTILSAIIARQVFKHYADFLPGVTEGNGAVYLPTGQIIESETAKILNFSSDEIKQLTDKDQLINKLNLALQSLKKAKFVFRERVIQENTTLAVNAGAYHMEASVGRIPATEAYLEERRDIETDLKRAELAHLKTQTEAGVFLTKEDQKVSADES